jgi:uncharacterized caspase-like protein
MRRFYIYFCTVFFILTCLVNAVSYAAVQNEHRVALVIGNSKYKMSPLANPGNDARDMSKKLKALGFKVILKTDANQKEMIQAIRDFGISLREKRGVGLFYFAGHGIQVNGENYLLPIGTDIMEEDEVIYESVNVNRILEKMDRANGRVNVVILDACRNNPFERSFRSAARGLAQMKSPSGTLIAFATEPGNVAMDGEGRNGVYTQNLLKHLETENLDIGRMFRRVRSDVMKSTSNRQTPWESSSLTGDFYFKQIEKKSSPKPVNSTDKQNKSIASTPTTQVELEFWRSIEDSNKIEYYQSYLKAFPNGHFVPLAKLKIQELEPASSPTEKSRSETPAPKKQNVQVAMLDNQSVNQHQISKLLDKAHESEASNRLTSPAETSALHYYSQILNLVDDHPEAVEGLQRIEERYLSWATSAINRGDVDKADTYLTRALLVNPESDKASELRKQLNEQSGSSAGSIGTVSATLLGKKVFVGVLKSKVHSKQIRQARAKTVETLEETLSPFFSHVKTSTKALSVSQNIKLARKLRAQYMVLVNILHWEDRNTVWSGRPDKAKVELQLINVRNGKTVDRKIFEKESKWEFGSKIKSPEQMLEKPFEKYFSKRFKTKKS